MDTWREKLLVWLVARDYSKTSRRFGHPCEYQRGNTRIKVNESGIILLKDPGAGIQISYFNERWTPNARRVDAFPNCLITFKAHVMDFENREPLTRNEAKNMVKGLAKYGISGKN